MTDTFEDSKSHMSTFPASSFSTSDGVRLNYIDVGEGQPLVMLPGWTQPAIGFEKQISALSRSYRCIALDPRCHGDSQHVEHGSRVSRFAKDCMELLDHLNLDQASLLGHSSGCVVIWSLIDLFGQNRVRSLILCDQMAVFVHQPDWTAEQSNDFGAMMGPEEAFAMASEIEGSEGARILGEFIRSEFADDFPADQVDAVVAGSLRVPRRFAAALMRDIMLADYRDVLPEIRVPTLCLGGIDSHVGEKAMGWIASQIPKSNFKMIPARHFLHLENPNDFNSAVMEFLDRVDEVGGETPGSAETT